MRIKLLGETHHPKHIRPLNDAKAIDAGANFISETFLFSFAALLSTPRPPRSVYTPVAAELSACAVSSLLNDLKLTAAPSLWCSSG